MASYLVTGGAGFIGSHIISELARRGERVRVLDNFSTGRRENLQRPEERGELSEILNRDTIWARLRVYPSKSSRKSLASSVAMGRATLVKARGQGARCSKSSPASPSRQKAR